MTNSLNGITSVQRTNVEHFFYKDMENYTIALIDCDSFFVSCERLDNPLLRQKPVCVMTGNGERGIVVSRSNEAKAAGVKMGEPYFQARTHCANVVFLPARQKFYSSVSEKVMNVLKNFTPEIEKVSIDEAYADIGGILRLYKKNALQLAMTIRNNLLEQTSIPVSIGIASSKTLAKLASDKAKKNNGIFIIPHDKIIETVGNTSIEEVCGIGRQHNRFLQLQGIFTIKDFLQLDNSLIRKAMGIGGLNLKYELSGYCTSKVDKAPHPPKSIQDTSVLSNFTNDCEIIEIALRCHIRNACRRLRHWNGFCATVGVMLREKNFQIFTEHAKLAFSTNSEHDIAQIALPLLKKIYQHKTIYRSCGIILDNINYPQQEQPSLFNKSPDYKDDRLSRTIDALEEKFGNDIVKIGCF